MGRGLERGVEPGQHRGEDKVEKNGSGPAGSSEDLLPSAGKAAPARSRHLGGPRIVGAAGRLRVCLFFVSVFLPFSVSWRKPGRAGADRRTDLPTVPHLCLATRTPISLWTPPIKAVSGCPCMHLFPKSEKLVFTRFAVGNFGGDTLRWGRGNSKGTAVRDSWTRTRRTPLSASWGGVKFDRSWTPRFTPGRVLDAREWIWGHASFQPL